MVKVAHLFSFQATKGQVDLIGLMIEASSGKHTIDQTKELTTNILNEAEDDIPQTEKSADGKKPINEVRHATKAGKYLLSGT
jgi:3-isopropylmalate dehydratase small subunit